MGVYIYTVRKQIKSCHIEGVIIQVSLLKYLQRASYSSYGTREESLTTARLERARQCWNSLKDKPKHVALGDKFEDGVMVYEWNPNHYMWYDCDNIGRCVGLLRRVRNGRRVEWHINRNRFEVMAMVQDPEKGRTSHRSHAWTREEALKVAQGYQDKFSNLEYIELRLEGVDTGSEYFFESEEHALNRKLRKVAQDADIPYREVSQVMRGSRIDTVEPLDQDRISTFQEGVAELTALMA